MADIRFQGEYSEFRQQKNARRRDGMAGWLINKGIVSSQSQANVILVAIVVVSLCIAFYFAMRGGDSDEGKRIFEAAQTIDQRQFIPR